MAYGLNIYNTFGTINFSSDDPGNYYVSEKMTLLPKKVIGGVNVFDIISTYYNKQKPLTFVSIPVGNTIYAYDQFGALGTNIDTVLAPDGVHTQHVNRLYCDAASVSIVNSINTDDLSNLNIVNRTSGQGIQIFSATQKVILDNEVEIVNILASVDISSVTPSIGWTVAKTATVNVPTLLIDGKAGNPYIGINLLGRTDESASTLYCYKIQRTAEQTYVISSFAWKAPVGTSTWVNVSGPILTAGAYSGNSPKGTIPFARFK